MDHALLVGMTKANSPFGPLFKGEWQCGSCLFCNIATNYGLHRFE